MTSVWSTIIGELRLAVHAALPTIQAERITFETPPSPELGDVAVPCFALARRSGSGGGRSPNEVAQQIADALAGHPLVASATVAGPYVNVVIDGAELARRVLTAIGNGKWQMANGKGRDIIVLEFISPNANKPLHLGHLRNAFLGEAIARLLEAQGHEVHRVCLVNDRGAHIMKSMLAYAKWGAGSTPESEGVKGDHFVGKWYVRFAQENKKQGGEGGDQPPTPLERDAAELLRKWEAGDPATRELWERMTNWALDGLRQSYAMMGTSFEREYLESAIWEEGRDIVRNALARGIFLKDERGNTIAALEDRFKLPNKIVERVDGTTVYSTQDIALAVAKERDYHPNRSIIVTGNEQDLYFKQLFAIFDLLGYDWAKACVHKSYGMVELPEGKMKSREGTVVDADDLIEELTRLAEEEIRKRADIVPGEPAAGTTEPEIVVSDAALGRARDIALAAVKFYLLLVTPETTVTFNPKESLAFTGKTGPYIQYMHARICSIFRKAEQLQAANSNGLQFAAGNWELLAQPVEKQLLLRLARFPDVVATTADQLDPSGLAQYLYNLAKTFADFYRDVPVLSARGGSALGGKAPSPELRDARLALCGAVRATLAQGLTLLGIAPLEEM